MQQLRHKLSRLKSRIEERLPDGDDLFSYPGVSRSGLLEYVEDTYGLTSRIEELRGNLALTVLRRKVDPKFSDCKKFLGSSMETKDAQEQFDGFLNSLTFIHDEIYIAYVIYCSPELRTEAQVGATVESLKTATRFYNEQQPQIQELLSTLESIRTLSDEASGHHEHIESLAESVETAVKELSEKSTAGMASSAIIAKFEAEVKSQAGRVANLLTASETTQKKLKEVLANVSENAKSAAILLETLKELEAKNKEQSESIETTLRLASKFGMASSFLERKKELGQPMVLWAAAFLGSMAGLGGLGWKLIEPALQATASPGDIPHLIARITLLAPLIWMGWMAAKQYGYTSRIREDYSFKYASALAFEGYKKEAAEVNAELMEELLKVATENMALNPLRIYEGTETNHASPVQELLASALQKVDTKSLTSELREELVDVIKARIGVAAKKSPKKSTE